MKIQSQNAVFILRFLLVILIVPILESCAAGAAMHCVDAVIPRPSSTKTFAFDTLDLKGKTLASSVITCHKAYNGQCSVRGNYYQYSRDVSGDSLFLVPLTNGDSIEVSFPSCKYLLEEGVINAGHFGRRYVDKATGERINILIYVYEGGGIGSLVNLHEGYVYYDKSRDLQYIKLPFTFVERIID